MEALLAYIEKNANLAHWNDFSNVTRRLLTDNAQADFIFVSGEDIGS